MTTMVEQEIEIMGWHPSFRDDTARLCQCFSDESLNEYGLGVDQQRLDEMTEMCKDLALFLLVDGKVTGLIAGMLVKNLCNGDLALQETVWYMDPEHRSHGKKLMVAFEQLGRDKKAKSIVMGLMCNSMQKRLDIFYKRQGYRPFEVQYLKELN